MNNRWIGLLIFFFVPAVQAQSSHKGISFQGVIKLPSGEYPTRSGLTVTSRILSPNNCILREEQFTGVNVSNGYINITIGAGSTGGYDPGLSMKALIDNSAVISGLTCLNADGTVNAGVVSFNPTATTGARKFRLNVEIDSIPVIADFNMRAMAYAINSETLNGKTEGNFVNTSTNITQAAVESWFASTVLDQLSNGTYVASNVTGTVAIANGGTGATSAASALANLLPSQATHSGKVLSTDGSSVSWAAIPSAPVTSVAGKAGVVSLAAADISDFSAAVDANLPTIPVSKGGTGVTSLTANRLIATNGTGSALTPFNCGVGQLLTFDASGIMGCTAYSSSGLFTNEGNSFGGIANLGTNDNFALNLKTNNSTKVTVSTVGSVGISTTAPATTLHIVSTQPNTSVHPDRAGLIVEAEGTSVGGRIASRVYSSTEAPIFVGYHSRGTKAAPAALLNGDVITSIAPVGYDGAGGWQTGAHVRFVTTEDWSSTAIGSAISFRTPTNGTIAALERMRIDNTGNVGIGTSSPGEKLDVNGGVRGTSAYQSTSDRRYKKNIETISDALDKVLHLRGVTFDWRTDEFQDKNFKTTRDMGVIAQEVEKVFPEAVVTDPDGFKSVAYSELVAPLINSVKELYSRNQNLEKENAQKTQELQVMKDYLCAKDPDAPFCPH